MTKDCAVDLRSRVAEITPAERARGSSRHRVGAVAVPYTALARTQMQSLMPAASKRKFTCCLQSQSDYNTFSFLFFLSRRQTETNCATCDRWNTAAAQFTDLGPICRRNHWRLETSWLIEANIFCFHPNSSQNRVTTIPSIRHICDLWIQFAITRH